MLKPLSHARNLAAALLTAVAIAAPAAGQERPHTVPEKVQAEPSPERSTVNVSVDPPAATLPATALSPVEIALRNALDGLRRDIMGAPFSVTLTIGQFSERVQAATALDAAIQAAEQPGGPRWREGECELRVELPGTTIANILADAARKRPAAVGMTSEAFDRRLQYLSTQRYSAIGRSKTPTAAMARPAVSSEAARRLIPADPPAWIRDQMDADGRGDGPGLKGARAGEAVALAQLRVQVNALVLSEGVTLGQAGGNDSRIDNAVSVAIRQARVSRVIYAIDGVEVRVSFELAHLWRELIRIP